MNNKKMLSSRKSERINSNLLSKVNQSGNKEENSNLKHNQEKKPRKRFVCEKCGGNEISDTNMKKKSCLTSRIKCKPKLFLDMKVCHSCYKTLVRSEKKLDDLNKKMDMKKSDEDAKQKYLSSAHSFALSLVQALNDEDARRLYCPQFKSMKTHVIGHACACVQKYIIGTHQDGNSHERARQLLQLLKQAKLLSEKKFYSSNDGNIEKVGLGNGQKKSKEFEEFVLKERLHLRDEYHLCEPAVQKILFYSNNFLHKKRKTEKNESSRVERKKGKKATGKLKSIEELKSEMCCMNECIKLVRSHPVLIQLWRDRANCSQTEARTVLAEMLTPTQGVRNNCSSFISLVTGASLRTITSVKDQLKMTGGNCQPPEHGLKRFWQEMAKKQQVLETNQV